MTAAELRSAAVETGALVVVAAHLNGSCIVLGATHRTADFAAFARVVLRMLEQPHIEAFRAVHGGGEFTLEVCPVRDGRLFQAGGAWCELEPDEVLA